MRICLFDIYHELKTCSSVALPYWFDPILPASISLFQNAISCNHCVNSIEGALKNIGVSGKVALEKKIVQVDFDETVVTLEAIKEAINNQGYQVR